MCERIAIEHAEKRTDGLIRSVLKNTGRLDDAGTERVETRNDIQIQMRFDPAGDFTNIDVDGRLAEKKVMYPAVILVGEYLNRMR